MPTQRRAGSRSTERPRAPREPEPEERLQKVLARAGFGSRRSAEDLIRDGRVTVNGRVAELGARVRPSRDHVGVDGVPVAVHPELRYFAFNKPAGVTTTMRDPHAERSIASFLPPGPRVFAVGRLDRETEGLLILTNDGELANRLQHPRHGVEKEYLAEVDGEVSPRAVRRLLDGVELEDGVARAARARIVDRRAGRSAVSVAMREGRKREVRRMLREVGHHVRRLVRTRVGSVRLGTLPPGEVRPLAPEEVRGLYADAGLGNAAPRRPR